jgi:phosphoribosyl-ATP pyrophosphohydrolase
VSDASSILDRLMTVLEDRNQRRPAGSYTTQLLQGGLERIGAKVIEEANELVEAARQPGEAASSSIVHETADLFYHVLVLLVHAGVPLSAVEAELARRFGVSGLIEKASR